MAEGDLHPPDHIRRILLSVAKRRRLYEAIVAMPGSHVRRLSRELAMALGLVEHHVRHLEKHGLVFSHRGGRRRTYYAAGQVQPEDVPWIHALRKPAWARLAGAIAEEAAGVASLARRLEDAPSTVSYNLRMMRDAGVLDHVQVGRESVYALRDAGRIRRLLAQLHPEAEGGVPDPAFAGLLARAAPAARPGERDPPTIELRMRND